MKYDSYQAPKLPTPNPPAARLQARYTSLRTNPNRLVVAVPPVSAVEARAARAAGDRRENNKVTQPTATPALIPNKRDCRAQETVARLVKSLSGSIVAAAAKNLEDGLLDEDDEGEEADDGDDDEDCEVVEVVDEDEVEVDDMVSQG